MANNREFPMSQTKANEAAVLGSMILDNKVIPDVLLRVREDSFLLPENQLVFRAIRALWFHQSQVTSREVKPERIDGVALRAKLCSMGLLDNDSALDQAGGVQYLAEIMQTCPSAANALYYAELVRQAEKDRQIRTVAAEIAEIAEAPGEPDDKLQAIQEKIFDLGAMASDRRFIRFADAVDEAMVSMLSGCNILKTGFAGIDKIIGGFSPGDFVILGARPNMGKTTLALNIGYNVAKAGKSVLVFSLEMPVRRLVDRLLCTIARVDSSKIRQKDQDTEEDRERFYTVAYEIKQEPLPMTFVDIATTAAEIKAMIQHHKQVLDLDLVIVDYIQLLSTGHREKDLRHTVTDLSKKLKRIAQIENVPILALSQLSRAPESRQSFKPRMSDLRESGALEQDADLVMLLHREDYYHKGEREWLDNNVDKINLAELIVDKNRHGPCGVADLVFCPDYCQFADKAVLDSDDIPI